MKDPFRRLKALRAILVFSVISTAAHFTHNFIEVDQYPGGDVVSGGVVRVAILIAWPLFTAIGLYAYRLYNRRQYSAAYAGLAAYAFFDLTTLSHFIFGSPNIPTFWYVTIFTDALAGVAVLAFVLLDSRRLAQSVKRVQLDM